MLDAGVGVILEVQSRREDHFISIEDCIQCRYPRIGCERREEWLAVARRDDCFNKMMAQVCVEFCFVMGLRQKEIGRCMRSTLNEVDGHYLQTPCALRSFSNSALMSK